MKFISPTNGRIEKQDLFEEIYGQIQYNPNDYKIMIGTDSQTFDKTKMVTVIALHTVGRGGKFWYRIEWLDRIRNLSDKIYTETNYSIELAREINDFLHEHGIRHEVEIHSDIGPNGDTKKLIQGIVGWINTEGFIPKIKYNSFVASCIADRISK